MPLCITQVPIYIEVFLLISSSLILSSCIYQGNHLHLTNWKYLGPSVTVYLSMQFCLFVLVLLKFVSGYFWPNDVTFWVLAMGISCWCLSYSHCVLFLSLLHVLLYITIFISCLFYIFMYLQLFTRDWS